MFFYFEEVPTIGM